MEKKIFVILLGLCFTTGLLAQPIFSLDDDPSNPASGGPLVPGFFSAEDELGCQSIQLGPSRSLAIFGFAGSDILTPGPAFFAPIVPFNYVDSLSSNHAWNTNNTGRTFFSVDRLTMGVCGTALQAQSTVWDQAGDTFATAAAYTNPRSFVGPLGGAPACWSGWVMPTAGSAGCGNILMADQAAWGLVSNSPNPPCPFCDDNVDGMDWFYINHPNNNVLYWTMAPADASLFGLNPADIYFSPPAFSGFNVYATSGSMGLGCWGPDSIDALVVFDRSIQFPNPAQPGVDYALFSLSPCSKTISALQGMGLPVDAGTIFFTDFQGNFAIYLWSSDLGAGGNFVNVDALDYR